MKTREWGRGDRRYFYLNLNLRRLAFGVDITCGYCLLGCLYLGPIEVGFIFSRNAKQEEKL
jgi:hypothetical protein